MKSLKTLFLLTIYIVTLVCSPLCGSANPDKEHTADRVVWIKIPAGSFMMGSHEGDSDERPVREVKLESFFISKTEVTVGQYRTCVKAGKCSSSAVSSCTSLGGGFLGGSPNWTSQAGPKEDHPINCISWSQARTFAKWAGGDLCSESQWAYSARAGEDFKYAGSNNPDEVAWYHENSESTRPVGQKKPNAWGLYDMSGNVWEWTLDEYRDSYAKAPTNGQAVCSVPTCDRRNLVRVDRGGGTDSLAKFLRLSFRSNNAPSSHYDFLGVRVCKTWVLE